MYVICKNIHHKHGPNGVTFEPDREHGVAVAQVDEATARELVALSDAYHCPKLAEEDASDTSDEMPDAAKQEADTSTVQTDGDAGDGADGSDAPASPEGEQTGAPLPDDLPGVDALREAGITTEQELTAFWKEGGDVTDISGIGDATKEKIDDYFRDTDPA